MFDKLKHFSPEIQAAVIAVLAAGKLSLNPSAEQRKETFKAIPGLAKPQGLVTPADQLCQDVILQILRSRVPQAEFVVEEKALSGSSNFGILKTSTGILTKPSVAGVDAIDGSNSQSRDLGIFSHSVGWMQHGKLMGGAIFAPALYGGQLVCGEVGKGVKVLTSVNSPKQAQVRDGEVSGRKRPKVNVYLGIDFLCYSQFSAFVANLHNDRGQFMTANTTPSCAWALSMIAAGGIDVLVQPHQAPYDFFGGAPLVEAAGGAIIWYHYRSGQIERLNQPDEPSFDPRNRKTGFIAGASKELCEWMFSFLQENWR